MTIHTSSSGGAATGPRTSECLLPLACGNRERLAVSDILSALGDRGFGLLLLVFTLPNAIPLPAPPGLSAILALPLILVATQMMLGLERPRLPGLLQRLTFSRTLLQRAHPHLVRLERRLRPRHAVMASERMLGIPCLVLAIVLAMPIPMGNVPVAWAVLLIAMGVLERDGLFAMAGLVAGAAAVAWNGVLIFAGSQAIAHVTRLVSAVF